MTSPLIPISWGELLDKITILQIKFSRIDDIKARNNIKNELDLLNSIMLELPQNDPKLLEMISKLSIINKDLWDIEDSIREKEKNQDFDEHFINLARSVYKQNDKRAAVKREINHYLCSDLIEEKSYHLY